MDPTTKQDLINQANDIAEKANKNIDKATSNDAVLKAADEGVNEINSINIPSLDSALEQALNAIQDALTNKLDEINKATYLPQSERNELINQANVIIFLENSSGSIFSIDGILKIGLKK